ncbi:hypothetical protein DAT35_37235 [Vitiosangium sp. GDMCC 1.1324]|nr:hypothetical protein DAT35_37235 [Vitiosangium sp. GDMCC 1.1324]
MSTSSTRPTAATRSSRFVQCHRRAPRPERAGGAGGGAGVGDWGWELISRAVFMGRGDNEGWTTLNRRAGNRNGRDERQGPAIPGSLDPSGPRGAPGGRRRRGPRDSRARG